MNLKNERKKLYDMLEKNMVNLPLEKYECIVPNNNIILIKRQCDSLFGSHYDKPYVDLFKYYESNGLIKPGDKVFESTSGSAGISFSAVGKILGYECHVALPAGGEKARENEILKHGAKLHLTDENDYVNSFLSFVPRFLAKNRDIFYLNHSMGKTKELINEITMNSFNQVAKEILKQQKPDYFVVANGNGSSLYGAGKPLHEEGVKIFGFESFQSALGYELLYPGKYKKEFGINPGDLSRHMMPGTSYWKNMRHLPIPHTLKALEENIVQDFILVSDNKINEEYYSLTGRNDTELLPSWDSEIYKDVGRSTRAGIAVCKKLAKKTFDKNYVIIGYDKSNRYDS